MFKRVAVAAGLLAAMQSTAQAEGHAVAAKVGALGLGVEYSYSISDRLAVRAGLNGSQIGTDGEESGIEYDIDLVWDSLSVALDFYPTGGKLRLTAGALKNDNRLETVARLSGPEMIGDTVYTPAEIGSLTGEVGFDGTAPFVGLGWDWSRSKAWGVSFDIGLVSQGDPVVDLRTSAGTLIDDPQFQQDLLSEEAQLAEELEDFDVVPYVSVGFVFRF